MKSTQEAGEEVWLGPNSVAKLESTGRFRANTGLAVEVSPSETPHPEPAGRDIHGSGRKDAFRLRDKEDIGPLQFQ